MHIQHYAIIFIAIVLPFSIVCRAKMNNKIDALNAETRINHALDTATFDAIDTIRDINDEFYSMYEGQSVDITPSIAMEGIKTFFETLSVNYGLPFVGEEKFNQSYFSPYVPAVLVIAYDGFYIYSNEQSTDGYGYTLSAKIPYAYECSTSSGTWVINFSLGNYIGLLAPNGMYYQGEFTKDYIDQAAQTYEGLKSVLGTNKILERLPQLSSDMSVTIYALAHNGESGLGESFEIPDFMYVNSTDGKASMLYDYDFEHNDDTNSTSEIYDDVSDFHILRRQVIVDIITQTLNEKMNHQNRYADMMGINYTFSLPSIARDDWMNAIDDVSVLAFVQGIPIGPKEYYNNYALGSSRIIQTEYIYGTGNSFPSSYVDSNGKVVDLTRFITTMTPNGPGLSAHIYHKRHCPFVIETKDSSGNPVTNVTRIYVNRNDAAAAGYYPCLICNP